MNYNKIIFISFIFLICACAASAQTSRQKLLEYFYDNAYKQEITVDTEIYPKNWKNAEYLGIKAYLNNNTDIALCIPSVFLQSSRWDNELTVLQNNKGSSIKQVKSHQNRDWPDRNNVIIVPNSEIVLSRNVVRVEDFEDDAEYSFQFRIPAFDCSIFNEGYPVSPDFKNEIIQTQGKEASDLLYVSLKKRVFVFKGRTEKFVP